MYRDPISVLPPSPTTQNLTYLQLLQRIRLHPLSIKLHPPLLSSTLLYRPRNCRIPQFHNLILASSFFSPLPHHRWRWWLAHYYLRPAKRRPPAPLFLALFLCRWHLNIFSHTEIQAKHA
jgi:hypothetical protein